MKKIVLIMVICLVFSSFNLTYAAEPFKDISKHWAKANILYLYGMKYVGGYPDGTYKPDSPVNVAEFLKMATLAVGYKLEIGQKVWYENFLSKALEIGLIESNEYPKVADPLTREQVAKIAVLAALHSEEKPTQELDELITTNIRDFSKISDEKKQYVIDAYRLGIMVGDTKGFFNPKATLTRAEMCTVIIKLADKTKREPFKKENGYGIILNNVYTHDRYVISRPEKKEEIGLAYKMLETQSKNKGWYCVSYVGDGDIISSMFYESNQNFIDDLKMNAALNMYLSRNHNLLPTYDIIVYEAKDVKELHRESISETLKYLFQQDYEKVMTLFDKNIEDCINGTAVATDTNYKFNNRRLNIFRPSGGSTFVFNIYKLQ